jgi:hypothetical protein
MQYLGKDLEGCIDSSNIFRGVKQLDGQVYREVENRRTIRFEWQGKGYFAKIHSGVGWLEILKNFSQFKVPVLGASNEWYAIEKLNQLGIDTMYPVAYVSEGWNPAKIHSSIVTRELEPTESLEDYCANNELSPVMKRGLIKKLATTSRVLHENGVNHRDYYICHFLLDLSSIDENDPKLFLIDLHRAQIRKVTPDRWKVKDIGGLFYSAFDLELTLRDLFRFMRIYSGRSLRATLQIDKIFWRAVFLRAESLYQQDGSDLPSWVLSIRGQLNS